MKNNFNNIVAAYFDDKFDKYGLSPQGVDWNGFASQGTRFEQVLKLIPPHVESLSINDIGCGYGQLVEYLTQYDDINYRGYDLSEKMIFAANSKYGSSKFNFIKINNFSDVLEADYSVSSGIYNMKLDVNHSEWTDYVLDSLRLIHEKSKLGFSFNMLTSYSDAEKKRDDLYYGDPCFYFDFCKNNFSKNVALLHNYGLYDFTILVNK